MPNTHQASAVPPLNPPLLPRLSSTSRTHGSAVSKATTKSAICIPGERRLSTAMLAAEVSAIPFVGLPDGIKSHRQIVQTVPSALRLMGVSDGAIALAQTLANRTQARDWKPDSRPMCWPSNHTLCDELRTCERQLRRYIAELCEAGALIMRDSGNMKRHGARTRDGAIDAARTHGFDLSTWATNHHTFATLVTEHKLHCDTRADARRTAKTDKRHIDKTALLATDETRDVLSSHVKRAFATWEEMEAAHARPDSSLSIRNGKTAILTSLAHRMGLLRQESVAIASVSHAGETCVQSMQKEHGMSGRPDISDRLKNTTNTPINSEFVQAQRQDVVCLTPEPGSEPTVVAAPPPRDHTDPRIRNDETWRDRAPWDGGTLKIPEIRTSAVELTSLVADLRARIGHGEPTWGRVSVALREFARDAGISAAAVRTAETAMGWQSTLIALAIVASKAGYHFDVSPGAYFMGGIVKKAMAGKLDLRATLWGLRQPTAPTVLRKPNPTLTQPLVAKAFIAPGPLAQSSRVTLVAKSTARDAAKTDREEEKAEVVAAKKVRRSGPQVQNLAQALSFCDVPVAIKRGFNAAAEATARTNQPAPQEPDTMASVTAEIEAARRERRAAEAARLAVMTPAQRITYEQQEADRKLICTRLRRR